MNSGLGHKRHMGFRPLAGAVLYFRVQIGAVRSVLRITFL